MQHICNSCNHTFSNASNLKLHLKTAKFCKQLRTENGDTILPETILYTCEGCEKQFDLRQSYDKHILTCREKEIKHMIHNYERRITELEEKYNTCNAERERLQHVVDSYTKAESIYNTRFNQLLTRLVLFTDENLKTRIQQIDCRTFVYFDEPKTYNHFMMSITNNIKDMTFCTDISRKKMVIKRNTTEYEKIRGESFIQLCFTIAKQELIELIKKAITYCNSKETDIQYEYFIECRTQLHMIQEYIIKNGSISDYFFKQLSCILAANCTQLSKRG